MKKVISQLLFFCLLIVFCISGYYLFQYGKEEFQVYELEEHLEEEKQSLIEGENDFTKLLKENPDTVGWIMIPGTEIDYPVVQTDDDSYYLTHDYNKAESGHGSIFMDYRNSANVSDKHTILYGHNMRDGTMFHDLNEYKNLDFLSKHRYIEYRNLNGIYRWEIFSTYSTNVDFDYLQTEFVSNDVFLSFINNLLTHSQFDSYEMDLKEEDRILTLSTCCNDIENGRRVVHARLIEEVK